ncbi:hypothetical protein ACFL6W_01100 [Thermodesulfobacteriota bacterium]
MKKLVLILGLVLLAAAVGFSGCATTGDKTAGEPSAAVSSGGGSIDGRWTGSTEIEGMGTIPLGYDFISDGNKLTGTSDGQTGKIPIENGEIDGNKIKFDVTINFGGQDIVINYSGVLMGDEMKLSWPGQGGTQEVICTRE